MDLQAFLGRNHQWGSATKEEWPVKQQIPPGNQGNDNDHNQT